MRKRDGMRVWWGREKAANIHQTVQFHNCSELNWGGLEVRGISVQLWEPSVKNPNHFLSLLLPSHSVSLPSLSITTSAFLLLLSHTPSSLFPTLFFPSYTLKNTHFTHFSDSEKGHVTFLISLQWQLIDYQRAAAVFNLFRFVRDGLDTWGKLSLHPDVSG